MSIAALTPRASLAVFWLVHAPKIVCTLVIMFVGARFLFFAQDLVMLITKCIGLHFLMQLDTVLFDGLASNLVKEQVKHSAFHWHAQPSKKAVHFEIWGSSLLRYCLVLFVSLFYCRVWHAGIQ